MRSSRNSREYAKILHCIMLLATPEYVTSCHCTIPGDDDKKCDHGMSLREANSMMFYVRTFSQVEQTEKRPELGYRH